MVGLPPTGVRGLRQDRSPPHICDASRARPSSGWDAHGDSPDDTLCQEQSENITSHPRTTSLVTTGLVPVIPIA
jgi:hypothetical protein